MDASTWEYELSLFSEDIIASLLSRHPVLCILPHKPNGSLYFTDEIGKCVLLSWRERRNELEQNLKSDFPAFVETEHSFKQYLKRFVDVEIQSEHSAISQILGLSATLFEVLLFVHRKGITHFVRDASSYLSFMLSNVKSGKFYEEGGWSQLASVSAKLSEDYDEEICKRYMSENVCGISTSDEIENSSIDSNLECPIETLKGKDFEPGGAMSQKSKAEIHSPDQKLIKVTEKHSQEFVSSFNKPQNKLEKDPTSEELTPEVKEKNCQEVVSTLNKPNNELVKEPKSEEITPGEVKQEVVSTLNKPDNELEKEPKSEEITPGEVKQEVFSTLNKPDNELQKEPKSEEIAPGEVKQEVVSTLNKPDNELEKEPKSEEITPGEVKQEVVSTLNKPDNELEKEPKSKEITPGEAKQEVVSTLNKPDNELENEPKGEEISPGEVADKKSHEVSIWNKSGDEPKKDSPKKEVTPDEIKEKQSQALISITNKPEDESENALKLDCSTESIETSPIDCELTNEVDKFLIEEITTHFQVRFLSEEEIEAMNLFSEDNGKKDSNVHVLKRDEAIQADLVSLSNNQNIPTLKNLVKTAISEEEKQIPDKHLCINAAKKDQSLFKSPKPESNKEATPNKAKTPSSENSVKDTRIKTAPLNQNRNVTPLKTPTGTPKSSISSTGRNATEEKTPKKLKSNSAASKSSSPCFKTPTDKGVSKIQSKSSEKTEGNQNVLAAKAFAEMTKSSPKFSSTANAKSRRISDSSKSLPIVVQPKLCEKDPLNNLKSSSILVSIPKIKVITADIPIASGKGESTNPKSDNCQKSASREKMAGSSLVKSTDQSESKTPKSTEESLDTRSCKESSKSEDISPCEVKETNSNIKKSDQNKGDEPPKASAKSTILNTARRTRNVQEKNVSSDPKNEKPRWR